MMALDVSTKSGPETTVPRQLFEKRGIVDSFFYDLYGVTADGRRFLVLDTINEVPAPITVILDWPTLLAPRR